MFRRIIGFVYGLLCYLIFFGTFLYAIVFVGDYHQLVPWTIDHNSAVAGEPVVQRYLIDALLLGLFAIQHSIMARQWFKRRWTKVVAPMLERSTYVLIASLMLLLMFWQWRPLGATEEALIWEVQNSTASLALQGLFWVGWSIVLLSTFLIDHFDLFGLRQAYCYLKGVECSALPFKTPAFYKGVRHPIYLGFIIAFWSTPRMSLGHLFFAVMTTAYIILAIQFEERDLLRAYGERYSEYRKRVSMLAPLRFWKGETAPVEVTQKVAKS